MAGVACGLSFRAIGRRLGRPASTVSREIRRNTWFTPPTTAGPGGPTGPHG
ncbi:helix-turn-helix domain-containing protein [Bifidobacterium aemilianum]